MPFCGSEFVGFVVWQRGPTAQEHLRSAVSGLSGTARLLQEQEGFLINDGLQVWLAAQDAPQKKSRSRRAR